MPSKDLLVLKNSAKEFGIALNEEELQKFALYSDWLIDWNTKINLTAIKQPEEIVVKHFLDSLLVVPHLAGESLSVLDVGTGAGFPGVALKIVRPDLRLSLLDSAGKKVAFLKALSTALCQENVCCHGRAEELAHQTEHREGYDVVTARAVAALPRLCEYCLPLVKPGGSFIACKGPEGEAEVKAAKRAIELLGGSLDKIGRHVLPDGSGRSIIVIRKISQTPSEYPRKHAKILKTPL